MGKYYIVTIFLSMFLFHGCIEELNIRTELEENYLVVEGFITTAYGPHHFSLTRSAKYGSVFEGYSERVEGASIYIKDNTGDQVFLIEDSLGLYRTPSTFKAEVGRSYTLVIFANGVQYISEPETVVSLPPINEVLVEYHEEPLVFEGQFETGIDVYAQFDDPADEQNFLMWTSGTVYEFNSRPDLFIIKTPDGAIPAPKECCSTCWKFETGRNTSVNIYDDLLTNGNPAKPRILFVPDDGYRFQKRLILLLQHHSLTREAYQYYKLLKEQLSISGNIFDPPPASITGNIINVNNPDEPVIGYFHATDVRLDTISVSNDILVRKTEDKIINDDCRTVFNAFEIPPRFW